MKSMSSVLYYVPYRYCSCTHIVISTLVSIVIISELGPVRFGFKFYVGCWSVFLN